MNSQMSSKETIRVHRVGRCVYGGEPVLYGAWDLY